MSMSCSSNTRAQVARARVAHVGACAPWLFVLAPAAQDPKPQTPAVPVFENGQAQIVEAFKDPKQWIQHDLWVEADFDSDGDGDPDRLHVDVTRPRQTDTEGLKVAVVYESSPYFSGIGSTESRYFWDPKQKLGDAPPKRTPMPSIAFTPQRPLMSEDLINAWVPRGFAVVHSASPGTGLSEGCPTVGGKNESLAPKAVIDWLNGRAKGFTAPDGGEEVKASWCTGKVAMTGTSYNGTLSLAAATTGVDGLMVVAPDAPNTSYYHYYRSNGLVRHPGGYMGEDVDVLYDFINSGEPKRREWCNEHVRDQELAGHADRAHGDYSDFWAGRDYFNALDGVKCAVLLSHGLSDWNVMPEHSIRIFAGLETRGIPVGLYLHRGGHGGPPPMPLLNRWFSHYLYGVDNGVEQEPRVYIVREEDKRGSPTSYKDFPNPDAALVTLFPDKGGEKIGKLAPAENSSGAPSKAKESLVDDVAKDGASLAQAPDSENRLLYATAPLTAPLHISGSPRVTLTLASDKPATNLSVWLVALPWTETNKIEANVVTRGWADPQNHASLTKGEPLQKGKFVELTFELQPDDQIVPAGKQLGLMIFASDRDFTLWPPAGTRLTVDLAGTKLELPVVGGAAAFARATAAAK